MIKGVALRPWVGVEGNVQEGDHVSVTEARARHLSARKLFQPLPSITPPAPPDAGNAPAIQTEAPAQSVANPPLPPPQGDQEIAASSPPEAYFPTGSPTGAENAASSSPPAPRPKASRSKKPAGKRSSSR